ncbi:MAG: hypothetical protein CMO05_00515 [Thalassospira sp.]|nr:hypothetical protein [Thalassospira sp.]|tara:strand:- start:33664 stop:33849 length:186 start_codon:yes stop_codon:yes gene_type:complete
MIFKSLQPMDKASPAAFFAPPASISGKRRYGILSLAILGNSVIKNQPRTVSPKWRFAPRLI